MGSVNINLSLTEKSLTKDFVFKDVKTDLIVNANNRDIQISKDYNAVNNGIYNMFLFDVGERILLPEFGNSIYKYLYEPITDITAGLISDEIFEMFRKWEPRVKIQRIHVTPNPDQNIYSVLILYTVPALDPSQTLKFNIAVNARRT